MRINFTILLLLLLCSATLSAQERSDIFNPKTEITWLGIDFSDAKFLGDRERLGSESDIRHLLDAWNDLILREADKYDIAQAIDKKSLKNEIDVTKEHNAELDVLGMLSNSEKDYLHLNKDGVEEIISSYDFKGLTGIGLMFNVESFSKLNVEATIWITFINMGTKEIYFSERLVAPPAGGGTRNYWAGSMLRMIENIKKKEFEMWRKKFYRP